MPWPDAENHEIKPRILLAPLDWGLGHTTRCIPLVKEFLKQNCDVWLGGDEAQQAIFSSEFPELLTGRPDEKQSKVRATNTRLNYLHLPGYGISYAKSSRGLTWKILLQLPKIFFTARRENKWLKKMVSDLRLDAVISDNRYGLYSKSIPSIFLTHQLQIKTPFGKTSEKVLQKLNYGYINRFSECWIVDSEGKNNLAGELSHPSDRPKLPLQYIGALSRFGNNHFENSFPTKGHLLILLSGPEPQRSILEEKILSEVTHYDSTATIVRGLPASPKQIPSTGLIKYHNHLPTLELQREIEKAEWVIGRCGYSTVMDMMKLKKKTILIPTPGQTEQEYLSQHLLKNQLAFCISQKEFSLAESLRRAADFQFKFYSFEEDQLEKLVKEFLNRIKSK